MTERRQTVRPSQEKLLVDARIAPYGSWRSPITAELIASASVGLSSVMLAGDDVYWVEGRPAEGGRNVIVRRAADGRMSDVIPPPFNARTRVHEYGGGAYTIADYGAVVFANYADQRLYRMPPAGGEPLPLGLTVELRYADLTVDHRRGRLICVREDHRASDQEAVNTLVGVAFQGSDEGKILIAGADFYASPRLSPDGARLAWLSWNHPNVPWDGTELWMGLIAPNGDVEGAQRIAGGPEESIFQPEWSPDGTLYFVSDRTNWWNLYRWHDGQVEAVCPLDAEFGVPQWVFGLSTYAFESAERIVATYFQDGIWKLATIETRTGRLTPIPTPYTTISSVRAARGKAVFVAGAPTEPTAVVQLDVGTGKLTPLKRASELPVDPGYLSEPEPIEFPTEHGLTAHGIFYPPRNPDFRGPPDERPPLLVMIHGGPTSATSTVMRLGIQYWTSRGFAVLDVNYGGSTGYGRAYRRRLDGQWGVVDVDDCVNGARFLVQRGDVDAERLAITGGSAGGYTVLCALTFRDVFRVGASYYGISDLAALNADTHKFESRYNDRLIGPYPERRDVFEARSPIFHVDQLARPVIFLQGLEDKVVLPNQAERMVDALKAKGLPVAYLAFAGEQHGFRRAETIVRAQEAELYFYSRILGFTPADSIEPVPIANLP
jgi:dipeptidyl aminopeptidase/acylaminoacyl peptidase